METIIGVIMWGVLILLVVGYRSGRKRTTPPPRPVAPPAHRDPAPRSPVAGWMLGHAVAHDQTGFPGDPLPHGHLGSPANLAFWGGVGADPDVEDEIEVDDDLGDDD